MSAMERLVSLLKLGGPLLLDFDGPICSIFAGYPAPVVAAGLVNEIRRHSVVPSPAVVNERDPLEVLRWAGRYGVPKLITAVEDALCAAEIQAAETAEPTPYGREVIVAARQANINVAVVSNNSPGAVTAYLTTHRLAGHVFPVIGRQYGEPERMKPNPDPILRAVRILQVDPGKCVLIGDSLADIDGARAAGVRVIAYANRPTKVDPFERAGADAIITTMDDVARVLMTLA